ncbi:MAG: DMT family transporter [Alphaproteobacteria bacterium]|nr:DMT family transporter [Alphaproteobacteria bacterium]
MAYRMDAQDWTMLLALSVIWGGSFLLVALALPSVPPFTLVWLRVALAALTLAAAVRWFALALPRDWGFWLACVGMGLLNNAVPFSLIVWGQTQIPSGLAAILNATTPLFAVLFAHVLTTDERLTKARLAGVVIGLVGVVILVGPAALGGVTTSLAAQAAVLGAAISYALAGLYGRRFRARALDPLVPALGMTIASTLLLAPVMLWVDRPWHLPMPPWSAVLAIVALAVGATAIAYILYFRLLARAGATNLMLVTFLIPVGAIALGALVLGERLAVNHLIGMAGIAAGLAAIDGRLLSRRPRGV